MVGLTKQSINEFSDNLIAPVNEGEQNPLDLFLQLKALEELVKITKDKLKDEALSEAEKHGAKSFELHGVKVEVASVKTDYDFSGCHDEKLFRLEFDLECAKAKVEERKEFLKSLRQAMNIVTDDGEGVTIYPPVKRVTTGIKTTFKKQ